MAWQRDQATGTAVPALLADAHLLPGRSECAGGGPGISVGRTLTCHQKPPIIGVVKYFTDFGVSIPNPCRDVGRTFDSLTFFWRSTMRPSPKMSVCLAATSVVLLLAFCNSVRTAEPEQANPGVKELQQKRLAVLEQMADTGEKLFQSARISYEEVSAAQRELLAAHLELAQTRDERIKACDEALKEALECQAIVKAQIAVRGFTHRRP